MDYREQLAAYKENLKEKLSARSALEVQARELETEIEHLKKVIEGLTLLAGESVKPQDLTGLGFSDACRNVLKTSIRALTPTQIRDALVAKGYDLKPYSNPLASIHTIIKRLEANGEVTKVAVGSLVTYKWKPVKSELPPPQRVSLGEPPKRPSELPAKDD